MSGRVESRKRSREDDGGEMPLSKRINNLHLTNTGTGQNGQTFRNGTHGQPGTSSSAVGNGLSQDVLMPEGRAQQVPYNHALQNGHRSSHNTHNNLDHHQQSASQAQRDAAGYDPELTQSDNPHYYQKNKLLYELHFMRSRKCHPDNN